MESIIRDWHNAINNTVKKPTEKRMKPFNGERYIELYAELSNASLRSKAESAIMAATAEEYRRLAINAYENRDKAKYKAYKESVGDIFKKAQNMAKDLWRYIKKLLGQLIIFLEEQISFIFDKAAVMKKMGNALARAIANISTWSYNNMGNVSVSPDLGHIEFKPGVTGKGKYTLPPFLPGDIRMQWFRNPTVDYIRSIKDIAVDIKGSVFPQGWAVSPGGLSMLQNFFQNTAANMRDNPDSMVNQLEDLMGSKKASTNVATTLRFYKIACMWKSQKRNKEQAMRDLGKEYDSMVQALKFATNLIKAERTATAGVVDTNGTVNNTNEDDIHTPPPINNGGGGFNGGGAGGSGGDTNDIFDRQRQNNDSNGDPKFKTEIPHTEPPKTEIPINNNNDTKYEDLPPHSRKYVDNMSDIWINQIKRAIDTRILQEARDRGVTEEQIRQETLGTPKYKETIMRILTTEINKDAASDHLYKLNKIAGDKIVNYYEQKGWMESVDACHEYLRDIAAFGESFANKKHGIAEASRDEIRAKMWAHGSDIFTGNTDTESYGINRIDGTANTRFDMFSNFVAGGIFLEGLQAQLRLSKDVRQWRIYSATKSLVLSGDDYGNELAEIVMTGQKILLMLAMSISNYELLREMYFAYRRYANELRNAPTAITDRYTKDICRGVERLISRSTKAAHALLKDSSLVMSMYGKIATIAAELIDQLDNELKLQVDEYIIRSKK